MELSHRTLAIYKEMQRFLDLHGYVPSLRELGAIVGCSASTVKRHLEKLQAAGLLQRAGRSARSYVIRQSPSPSGRGVRGEGDGRQAARRRAQSL
jgi:predicted ArsR family transcriptional regulator